MLSTQFKAPILIAAAVVLALLMSSTALADVGARPMGMGGAFVAVADDANATFWNPAGLTNLKAAGVTWMRAVTNHDTAHFQDYLTLAGPVGKKFFVGASWLRENIDLGARVRLDVSIPDLQNWYWGSLAYKATPNTSIGVNVRGTHHSAEGIDTNTGIDAGVLQKVGQRWTLGLMVQNINHPKVTNSTTGATILTWHQNVRPGISYRPDSKSIAAIEVYDAANSGTARALRVGYERQLASGLKIRAGYYGQGFPDENAFTIGIGLSNPKGDLDPYETDLDVAALIGDTTTILAGLSFKY